MDRRPQFLHRRIHVWNRFQQSIFVIREHKKYPVKILKKRSPLAKIETGKVYEQMISVMDESGQSIRSGVSEWL